jgi:hypothetical protein
VGIGFALIVAWRWRVLPGQTHNVAAKSMAPALIEQFT